MEMKPLKQYDAVCVAEYLMFLKKQSPTSNDFK